MKFEQLMNQYPQITFTEKIMPRGLSGLYYENVIEIDRFLTYWQKNEVVAEELGHYEKTVGDITDYRIMKNRKQEELARRWAIEKVVSLDDLIDCYNRQLNTVDDICCHLEVTPRFFHKAIKHYRIKHGINYSHKGYWIHFKPLFISKEPIA